MVTALPQEPPDMAQYPTMFDPSSLVRKGFCPVHSRLTPFSETHSLYFEQHGTGDKHVLLINGLNTNSFAWDFQVRSLAPLYSVLVFDNRGCGYSGYPTGRYTTSGMAEDIIVLLDHLGWTASRQIHVVGASLGGMIAQELALRIPDRIASLTLCVTTPGSRLPWQNLPPFEGLKALTTLLLTKKPEDKVPTVLGMLYPPSWLDAPATDDEQGRTNREVQTELYLRRVLLSPPQRLPGHIAQLLAALTHHVSPPRLRALARSIPKIVILCGDRDFLVDTRHSHALKACMPEAELVEWGNTGHGVHSQRRREFHELLVRIFEGAEAGTGS